MLPLPSITRCDQDGAVVLRLVGELDLSSVEMVRAELAGALDQSERVVLDLAETLFLDSTVLGAIVGASRRAADGGGWLRLAAARPNVERVLQITELRTVLGLYADPVEAITAHPSQRAPLVG